jgi:hypothetical protein
VQKTCESFKELQKSFAYKKFRSQINGIAIINTNINQVDDMRKARNEGSDAERSKWLFYTPLQNLMYQILYPGAIIDLATFYNCGLCTEDITDGIAAFLDIVIRIKPGVWDAATAAKLHRLQFPLPAVPVDLTTRNIETYVNRSLRRIGCNVIKDVNYDAQQKVFETIPKGVQFTNNTLDMPSGVNVFYNCDVAPFL